MELSLKERLFVGYYLGESAGNATDAARRAGYQNPNKVAHRLLVKVGIRAAIDAQLADAALTTKEILARVSAIANADLDDFLEVTDQGWSIDLQKAKKAGRMPALKKIKQGQHGLEIELHNPMPALDKLGQYRRLWDGAGGGQNVIRVEYVNVGLDGRPTDSPAAEAASEPGEDPGAAEAV